MTPSSRLRSRTAVCSIPLARDKVKKALKALEDADIIERVTGPTPLVSPIGSAPNSPPPPIKTKKKQEKTEKVRLCIDMRVAITAITQ